MKIITIRQPWAYALAFGWKDVENRSWRTNYRGPVALHAGLVVDSEWASLYPDSAPRPPYVEALHLGVIIGIADLVDVTRDHPSVWSLPGQFQWVFTNAHFIEPVPYVGSQGLRDLDTSLLPAVSVTQFAAAAAAYRLRQAIVRSVEQNKLGEPQ